MGEFCLYADHCQEAPCIVLRLHKYSYLKDFLEDNRHKKNLEPHSVPLIIECLARQENSEHKFRILDERCINCMFCIMGCTGNRILIGSNIHPKEFCYDIDSSELKELHETFVANLLNGEFMNLPPVKLSMLKPKYKRFEDFTGVDETKVSFDKMMQEGRYESQLLGYETELKAVDNFGYQRAKFLVIGGRECDLLHPTQKYATSGQRGELFYSVLQKHNFFFFSANALLAMALKKLFVSIEKYSLESIHSHMTSGEYLGLLSCGFIRRDGSIEPY